MKPCRGAILFTLLVMTLGTLSMMSACGQKGPLYDPQAEPTETEQKK